jgi:hypothetical protein
VRIQAREFYVSCVVTGESGMMTAIGRCGSLPIPIGTKFKVVYKEQKPRQGDPYNEAPVREEERPVNLTVVAVNAYGKQLNALPGNSTGGLVFKETELNVAPPGWMLSEE